MCFGHHDWPLPHRAASGEATLLLSSGEPLKATRADQPLNATGAVMALFLPEQALDQVVVAAFDGLVLRLPMRRLERAGAMVSGQTWGSRQLATLLQQPAVVSAGEEAAQRHLQRLEVVARMLDPGADHPQEEIAPLALDELLDRLVVLALWGDRLRRCPEGGTASKDREAILDELVRWIRANNHRPLSLTDLEQRSGYSDRSLRNAFQERYGCPPKQWIRRTRMEAARERLLNPEPGDSVSTIARDHGYQHVSQFSRDYRSVFGQRPSLVMRQARRSLF